MHSWQHCRTNRLLDGGCTICLRQILCLVGGSRVGQTHRDMLDCLHQLTHRATSTLSCPRPLCSSVRPTHACCCRWIATCSRTLVCPARHSGANSILVSQTGTRVDAHRGICGLLTCALRIHKSTVDDLLASFVEVVNPREVLPCLHGTLTAAQYGTNADFTNYDRGTETYHRW